MVRFGIHPENAAHPEDLDLLLLTVATARKVQRDGIQFASARYASPVLAAYVGEQVTVRYDPRDIGENRVYFNDTFLCRAIAPSWQQNPSSSWSSYATPVPKGKRELKHQLRERCSLADALPVDTRYAYTTPEVLPTHSEALTRSRTCSTTQAACL